MSDIINHPIVLDETGQRILEGLRKRNAYLAMIAEGSRADIYSSMEKVARMVRGASSVNELKYRFPIGVQIIAPWKNMAPGSGHDTDGTAYQVVWDVVHHGMVTLETGDEVPGVYLQMHNALPLNVHFDEQEAFFYSDRVLSSKAELYAYFADSWGHISTGTRYKFTFPKYSITKGELLVGFRNMLYADATSWTVSHYAEKGAYIRETVPVTSSAEGGTIRIGDIHRSSRTLDSNGFGLNSMERASYGSNRWSGSMVRRWLNMTGNWFNPIYSDPFDVKPDDDYISAMPAFMDGFNDDFLAAIRPVQVSTKIAYVLQEEAQTGVETSFDRFFLPSCSQIGAYDMLGLATIYPMESGVEGEEFEWWKLRERPDHEQPSASVANSEIISTDLDGNVVGTLLRTPTLDNAYTVQKVTSTGLIRAHRVNSDNEDRASVRPVCVIC